MHLPPTDPLEERLHQAAPTAELRPDFRYQLRRALLNSRHWTEPAWRRWRFLLSALPLPGVALAAGFLFALVSVPRTAAPRPTATPTLTVVSPATLERFAREGTLHYDHQRADGTRVYRLDLASGGVVELWDEAPYAIRLTSQPSHGN